MSASVYLLNGSTWAFTGASTLDCTSPVRHDRYTPEGSMSPTVNSSRYAIVPAIACPEARVTVTLDFACFGYNICSSSSRPLKRDAIPARSPVGEWQLVQPPEPSKYCLPA